MLLKFLRVNWCLSSKKGKKTNENISDITEGNNRLISINLKKKAKKFLYSVDVTTLLLLHKNKKKDT